MLDERWDDCVDIARNQVRVGAHLLDVCIDYVGRDGVADMREVVSRFASASTLPLVIDSTEPAVLQAGLELIGGRPVVNSVNFEDGDGPDSRFGRIMPLVKEHGTAVIALTIDEQGQARTAEDKVRIAIASRRHPGGRVGDARRGHHRRLPSPSRSRPARRRPAATRIETIEAIRQITAKYPGIHTTLGVSNVSFGLNPAARMVLNSVFLHEAVEAGLTSGIIDAAKIVPLASVPEEQRKVALDLVWDRREYDADGNLTYDPLDSMLDLFAGVDTAALKDQRAAELAALPVGERLERRIIDGEAKGLEDDLDLARAEGMSALDIINDHLLEGMKVVGERFGAGEMQLPFVLQSAEVMKTAVALLEPHMEKIGCLGQGHHGDRHRARRRARHRQEPGRHHPHQQRLRGDQPRHQAADRRHHRRGRGAQRRRDRHVRPAREVHRRDEGEPARNCSPAGSRSGGRSSSAAQRSPAPTSRTTSPASSTARSATRGTPSRASPSWSRWCRSPAAPTPPRSACRR